MKLAMTTFVLVSITSAMAFATNNESTADKQLRKSIQQVTVKAAKSMLIISGMQEKSDRIKLSTPSVNLGTDDEIREIQSDVNVESINGEPVAGGMSYHMVFQNGQLFSVKLTCQFCAE